MNKLINKYQDGGLINRYAKAYKSFKEAFPDKSENDFKNYIKESYNIWKNAYPNKSLNHFDTFVNNRIDTYKVNQGGWHVWTNEQSERYKKQKQREKAEDTLKFYGYSDEKLKNPNIKAHAIQLANNLNKREEAGKQYMKTVVGGTIGLIGAPYLVTTSIPTLAAIGGGIAVGKAVDKGVNIVSDKKYEGFGDAVSDKLTGNTESGWMFDFFNPGYLVGGVAGNRLTTQNIFGIKESNLPKLPNRKLTNSSIGSASEAIQNAEKEQILKSKFHDDVYFYNDGRGGIYGKVNKGEVVIFPKSEKTNFSPIYKNNETFVTPDNLNVKDYEYYKKNIFGRYYKHNFKEGPEKLTSFKDHAYRVIDNNAYQDIEDNGIIRPNISKIFSAPDHIQSGTWFSKDFPQYSGGKITYPGNYVIEILPNHPQFPKRTTPGTKDLNYLVGDLGIDANSNYIRIYHNNKLIPKQNYFYSKPRYIFENLNITDPELIQKIQNIRDNKLLTLSHSISPKNLSKILNSKHQSFVTPSLADSPTNLGDQDRVFVFFDRSVLKHPYQAYIGDGETPLTSMIFDNQDLTNYSIKDLQNVIRKSNMKSLIPEKTKPTTLDNMLANGKLRKNSEDYNELFIHDVVPFEETKYMFIPSEETYNQMLNKLKLYPNIKTNFDLEGLPSVDINAFQDFILNYNPKLRFKYGGKI